MRRSVFAACAIGVLAASAPAQAQEELIGECAAAVPRWHPAVVSGEAAQRLEEQFRFLCGQVVNGIAALHPTVGIAFSGGNPVLGTGSTLGTRMGILPRVGATGRVNVALIEAPDLFRFAAELDGETVPPMERMVVPVMVFQGDLSVGVFNGISIPPRIGGLGAIDLLGSVSFLPATTRVGLDETIYNVGGGARVGLLSQGLLTPGVSVSGMYRRMGMTSFGPEELTEGDAARFATDLRTISLRAVASKGIPMMDFAFGAGYDRYASDIDFAWRLECRTEDCIDAGGGEPIVASGEVPTTNLSTDAWNVFGNGTINLVVLRVVGELGYQWPSDLLETQDLASLNPGGQAFTERELGTGRVFGSLGLRLVF